MHLVTEAMLKSFWRRQTLRHFLRRCGVAEALLSTWSAEETKRDLLDRAFPAIEKADKGSLVITRMADTLAEQSTFPDLEGWEDSIEKKKQAVEAVNALRRFLQAEREKAASAKEREEARTRLNEIQQRAARQRTTLDKLDERLKSLAADIGTQAAGYSFQDWYYDLLDYFEVPTRKPYTVEGRQIDGSVTVDGTTYLNELKFTTAQSSAPDVDIFYRKIQDKADNTMGIMVSISGYSSVAIDAASGPRTPVLLLDHSHLYLLLTGSTTFTELVNRIRRHASQTGRAYLAVADFGR
jgi:hypothetical protein